MHHLGGVAAEDVHTEQLEVVGGDQQFQHAVGVAGDLAARQLAVARHAHLIGNRVLGQIHLGGADVGNLRDGVDPDRLQLRHPGRGLAKRVVRGQPALVHRRGGQRRKPDDRALERKFVRFGRAGESTDLSHELERCVPNLRFRRGRLKVE